MKKKIEESKIEKLSAKLIWLVFIGFSFLYSTLSLIHHIHFLSGAFDLGIFDQALWQYSHFIFPINTIKEKIILGDHLNLTLPLLSPLFWLWDDVRILLVFQAVWISSSVIPIFKYLILRGLTKFQSLILPTIYLLFYGMQYLVYFDFHTVAIGVGLLAWVLYFWESAKWKWFTVSLVLLLATQENMGIALLGLCILWFFQKKRKKLVIILSLIGVIYTVAAFSFINIISQGHLQYVPQFPGTIKEFFIRFFDTPDKKDVWLFSFAWYSFLSLFSPGAVLAVILDLAQYFITGKDFNHMWSPYLHHRAILSIFLLVGATDVLLFVNKKINLNVLVLMILLLSLFLQFHFHFALNKLSKRDYLVPEPWVANNNEMLGHVPEGVSLAAQQSLVPHLSHRKNIYLIYPRQHNFKNAKCQKNPCWWLDFAGKPELLVVDTHDNEWLTMTLADIKDFREAITNMEKSGVIELQFRKSDAKIYKINYTRTIN